LVKWGKAAQYEVPSRGVSLATEISVTIQAIQRVVWSVKTSVKLCLHFWLRSRCAI